MSHLSTSTRRGRRLTSLLRRARRGTVGVLSSLFTLYPVPFVTTLASGSDLGGSSGYSSNQQLSQSSLFLLSIWSPLNPRRRAAQILALLRKLVSVMFHNHQRQLDIFRIIIQTVIRSGRRRCVDFEFAIASEHYLFCSGPQKKTPPSP